jgi:hypothetical protein
MLGDTLATSPIPPPSVYEDWELVPGCPLPAKDLTGPDGIQAIFIFSAAVNIDVADASPHRLFVFLVPSEVYANDPLIVRWGYPYILDDAEVFCTGDLCHSASRAVYLPADLSDGVLREALLAGIGLLPYTPEPEPTFDRQGCEQGTPGIPFCSRYLECRTPTPGRNCDEVLEDLGVEPGSSP